MTIFVLIGASTVKLIWTIWLSTNHDRQKESKPWVDDQCATTPRLSIGPRTSHCSPPVYELVLQWASTAHPAVSAAQFMSYSNSGLNRPTMCWRDVKGLAQSFPCWWTLWERRYSIERLGRTTPPDVNWIISLTPHLAMHSNAAITVIPCW